MKIACPSCGMHYEVDSGSLGRYFRCTECKTLFLGLNAKSVKEPQYVAKKDEEHTGSTAGEDGIAITENEAEVLEAVEVVDDAQLLRTGGLALSALDAVAGFRAGAGLPGVVLSRLVQVAEDQLVVHGSEYLRNWN